MARAVDADIFSMVDDDQGRTWNIPRCTGKACSQSCSADPIIEGDKVFISSGYNHGGTVLKIAGKAPEKPAPDAKK
jgi:hypothetical protein